MRGKQGLRAAAVQGEDLKPPGTVRRSSRAGHRHPPGTVGRRRSRAGARNYIDVTRLCPATDTLGLPWTAPPGFWLTVALGECP